MSHFDDEHSSNPENTWDKKFDESSDDAGNLSRLKTKKKEKTNSMYVILLTVALIMIIVGPVIYFAYAESLNKPKANVDNEVVIDNHRNDKKDDHQSESVSKSIEESEKKAKSLEASSLKTKQANEASISKAKSDKMSADAAKEKQAASKPQAADTNKPETSSDKTYTVKPGDNAYRIALNHGMTKQELYNKNGLPANAVLKPGQVLKV